MKKNKWPLILFESPCMASFYVQDTKYSPKGTWYTKWFLFIFIRGER